MTVTAGWVMVPWKIVYSAASLLNFMTGLAVFLCPIAAIMATDYWLVKHRHVDVPGLYRRHGRYRYRYGVNWRAAVALLVSLVPNLPGYASQIDRRHRILTNISLANAVNSSLYISPGIAHLVSGMLYKLRKTSDILTLAVRHELSIRICKRNFHLLGLVVSIPCTRFFARCLHLRRPRYHRWWRICRT